MKKVLLFFSILALTSTDILCAQCPLGIQYPWTFDTSSLTISSRAEMICCLWGNEYMSVSNIVAGNTYTFDSCSAPANTVLTLFDPSNNTVAFNENSCSGGGALISSFTATISGTYKIQVNMPGCGGVSSNTPVGITLESTLGIQTNNYKQELTVFPNPTTGSFSIENNQEITKLSVYNIQGKLIKTLGLNQENYSISDLSTGVYFVTIVTHKGSTTKKLIKN